MYHDGPTPIPPTARDALEHVETAAGGQGKEGEIERSEAVTVLLERGFSKPEADEIIGILLDRGYLYAVGGQLRVTPDE